MFTSRSLAEQVAYVVDSIESYGVQVRPSSRVWESRRVLLNADNTPKDIIAPGDPGFTVAVEAVRDMNVMSFIFDNLRGENAPPDAPSRIKRLVMDAALPQHSEQNTAGRDMQFEMFVGASLVSGGMSTRYKEPDWVCVVGGHPYAVAVKRIKSLKSMERTVRKGAEQVRRSQLSGCIVTDVSAALVPDNQLIERPVTSEELGRAARHCHSAFMRDYHRRLSRCVDGKGVECIVIVDSIVSFDRDAGWTLSTFTNFLALRDESEGRWTEFRDHYISGMVQPEA